MFRFAFSKLLTLILVLTVIAACTSEPAPPTSTPTAVPPTAESIPTEIPPTEVVPTQTTEPYPVATESLEEAYPAPTENSQEGYPAPLEPSQGLSSLVGLPVIDLSNVAQLSVLASIPTVQDARIVWSGDGMKFAVFHPFNSGEIRVYSPASGTFDPLVLTGHPQPINGVAFSPDGTQLVSTGQDGSLRIWDTSTGAQVNNIDLTSFFQFSTWADTVEFSSDGSKLVVFAGQDSTLYLFNYPLDNTPPATIAWLEHASPVVSVYPSPDGQTFAWVGRGTLVLMNADGTFRGEQLNHEDFITNLFFTPDSQWLFVQVPQTVNDLYAGVVIVYDVQTGQAVQTLVHPDFVTASVLSPDSATLVTSSANKVTLWDWATGTERLSITDLPNVAYDLAFSPDGRLLVGTFSLGVFQVWDVTTGEAVASYQNGGELSGASFVLGGTVLAATQYDGTVQLLGIVP